jgi:predicted DNA-binding transcriptional regulator YafY
MLSYQQLQRVTLRVEKGEIYNAIKNRYLIGILEEVDLGSKIEIILQADSLEILAKQLIEYQSGIEIVEPDELKYSIRKHLAQITERCISMT